MTKITFPQRNAIYVYTRFETMNKALRFIMMCLVCVGMIAVAVILVQQIR